eukprot:GGOE01021640.1.p1 GENE.GGOE01021640.1~~GGOE01021640.1.p1  ORF type:complete len:462 (-),score=46.00 GGOE01021640.1:239-1624(-)
MAEVEGIESDTDDSEPPVRDIESSSFSSTDSTPAGKNVIRREVDDEEEEEDVPSVDLPASDEEVRKAPVTQIKPEPEQVQAPSSNATPEAPVAPTDAMPAGSLGSKSPIVPTPPNHVSRPTAKRPAPRAASASPARRAPSPMVPRNQRANSATPASRKQAPPDFVVNRGRPSSKRPMAHYLLSTETLKLRINARSQPLHLKGGPPSPDFQARRPPRKSPKAVDSGPKPPPEFKYVLGKRLADIKDQPSAAFASHTPRLMFSVADVPAPGYTLKEPKPTKSKAFPDIPDCGDQSKAITGFGSTAPRDLTYSLTNGTMREFSPKKQGRASSPPPKPIPRPSALQHPSWEIMPLYSSFRPNGDHKPSSWAMSKVERDPYEIERVKKELKSREPKKRQPGRVEPRLPPQPKKTEKEWVEFARKQVHRAAVPRDTNKAAFGTSEARQCLQFGKAPMSPAPGDYVVP